jgi:hypothetical protein
LTRFRGLQDNAHALQLRLTRWVERRDNEALPLLQFATLVYQAHAANIGLLGSESAATVVRFYGLVDFLNALQAVRMQYELADAPDRFWQRCKQALADVVAFHGETRGYAPATIPSDKEMPNVRQYANGEGRAS